MADERPVKIGGEESERLFYQELAREFGTPLLVYDESVVERHYKALCDALPDVRMYYAVKALPQEQVIRTIDRLGGGFDVASGGETDLLLKLKVFGRRTIHTHPVKKDEEIRTALRYGVTTFVIDNVYELEKFFGYRSRVGLILRVSFRSPGAIVDLSRKFGCNLSEVASIVARAGELGIHIKGLSFHVGSQCSDAGKHVESIEKCSELMLQLNAENDRLMNVLDIGGGFPADYDRRGVQIDTFCAPIREALRKLPDEWDIIAEPGRYLVAAAVTSITSVVGRSVRDGVNWYYLDDGAYGSYSGQIYDHACYPLQVLKEGPLHRSVLAGPTCDSIDVVAEDILLPELTAGDLIIGHEMGAYTAATRTRFNSLPDARFLDLASRQIVD